MKHLFVPYKLALMLKEKGFDEPCMSYYFPDGGFMEAAEEDDTRFPGDLRFYEYSNSEGENIAAPLYQQVIDFLETCGIYIRTYPSLLSYPVWWDWELQIKLPYKIISSKDDEQYKNKYEALNKAIEEALKLLP